MRIFLGNSEVAPYHEEAGARFHAATASLVLGQLVTVDEKLTPQPGLLESYDWDPITNSYKLKLRKGLKFHSGREVSSVDLEFTLLRGFFSPKSNFYNIYLFNIEGLPKPGSVSPKDYRSGIVSGVKIIDPLTVAVKLNPFNASFINALSRPYFSLVDKHALNGDFISWKSAPIGAGPYFVTSPFKDGKMELQKSESSPQSYPSKVTLFTKANSEQDFDISFVKPEFHPDKYRLILSQFPRATPMVFFNFKSEKSTHLDFRLLVKTIIDSDHIAKISQELSPLRAAMPRQFLPSQSTDNSRQQVTVKDLVKKLEKGGIDITNLKANAFPAGKLEGVRKKHFSEITKMFAQHGINLNIHFTNEKFLDGPESRKAHFSFVSQIVDYTDPLFMFSAFRSDSAYFGASPNDPNFDKLYLEIATERDPVKRFAKIQSLSKTAEDRVYFVRYLEEKATFYLNNETIKQFSIGTHPNSISFKGLVFHDR